MATDRVMNISREGNSHLKGSTGQSPSILKIDGLWIGMADAKLVLTEIIKRTKNL